MTEQTRYTMSETVRKSGLSEDRLRRLRRLGFLPDPEKHGRTRTYSSDILARLPEIIAAADEAASKKKSAASKEHWGSPVFREKVLTARDEAYKGRPEIREKKSVAMKRYWADSSYVERVLESRREAAKRPEARRNRSAATTRRWAEMDESERQAITQQRSEAAKNQWDTMTSETRQQMSEMSKRTRATPEYRNKMKAIWADQGKREANRRSSAAWQAQRKAELAALRASQGGRPATKAAIFAQALRLHRGGEDSWSKIAKQLIPSEFKANANAAGERLRKGVLAWRRRHPEKRN